LYIIIFTFSDNIGKTDGSELNVPLDVGYFRCRYYSVTNIRIDTTLHIIRQDKSHNDNIPTYKEKNIYTQYFRSGYKDKQNMREHSKQISHIHRLAEYATRITALDGTGNISTATTRTRTQSLISTIDTQETWSHRKSSNIQCYNINIQYISIFILILITQDSITTYKRHYIQDVLGRTNRLPSFDDTDPIENLAVA
jgi:hypothetical protein